MNRIAVLAASACLLPASQAGALDVNRDDVQAYVNELVKEHGLDADYLLAMLDGAESQQGILDAMARPAERTKPWREYRAIFFTPERIAAGVAFWNDNETRLKQVAEKTGVPPEMLCGIIGVETYFGQRAGKHRLLDSLEAEGIAVVTITHDMRFVIDGFRRVVAMAQGSVVVDGPLAAVFCDDDVLERSRLRRLDVAQLARDLNLSRTAVSLPDVLELIP